MTLFGASTVFVVAQPDSSLVLAKSFYRLLGTAVGILATTALVFGLAQYGAWPRTIHNEIPAEGVTVRSWPI